jgi:hypothetical protein
MVYPVPKIPGRRFVLLILGIDIQDLKVSTCNIKGATRTPTYSLLKICDYGTGKFLSV